MNDPCAVFVYGTLKRGQSREKCWPRKPANTQAATVRGTLYDLGSYPGLIEGTNVVSGEIWHFASQDMPPTLAVLDQIEGYFLRDDDEYRRVIVECTLEGKITTAWVYHYARPAELTAERRISPNQQGICQWPACPS